MADPVLLPYQYEIGGLVFGNVPTYRAAAPDGLFSTGELRVGDADKPLDDGMYPGIDYLSGRPASWSITVLGQVIGESDVGKDARCMQRLRALLTAWDMLDRDDPTATKTLRLNVAGLGTMRLVGRPGRLSADVSHVATGSVVATVEYRILDPLFYDDVESVANLGMTNVVDGWTYPRVYPFGYGFATSEGSVAINNGTRPVYPRVVLNGPLVRPRISNAHTGEWWEWAGTLGVGESLVVDFAARTVTLAGASRYSLIVPGSKWWRVWPGSNPLTLTAQSSASAGGASVHFRSAWLV